MLTPTTKNLLGSALYCSKSNKGNRTKRNTSPIAGASTSSRRRPHHAQRYRTTMPRMCQDEKHCILYFVLANAQPSCSPRQRLRLTTCCAVLAATRSADFSAHRLEKESVGSERVAFLRQREKKGRMAPKRIPESLAAQNFHWRCMANTIAKPSLGEHLRDRGTKKHRMIAKSV